MVVSAAHPGRPLSSCGLDVDSSIDQKELDLPTAAMDGGFHTAYSIWHNRHAKVEGPEMSESETVRQVTPPPL
eukprot:1176874-Prorocentrum_minimum.AAC.1